MTFTSISVSYHRGLDADPMTVMRGVKVRSTDLTRLERLQTLVRDLAEEPVDIDVARARFDELIRAPHPYRRWVVTAALAGLAAAAAALFGGTWLIMALSFVTTAVADRVQHWLARRGIAAFFTQAVGGAIPTGVAVALLAAASAGVPGLQGISPSLVVASGIVVLLAGLSVVGAAQDAIDGYYVTAGARVFEVLVLTLGIVVGVATVLAIARRSGVSMQFTAYTPLATNTVVQVLAATVVSGAFAVSAYAGTRAVVHSTVTGGLGWLVYLGAAHLGLGPVAASSLAALAAGFVSQVVSRSSEGPGPGAEHGRHRAVAAGAGGVSRPVRDRAARAGRGVEHRPDHAARGGRHRDGPGRRRQHGHVPGATDARRARSRSAAGSAALSG